jgi:hypothetical protein
MAANHHRPASNASGRRAARRHQPPFTAIARPPAMMVAVAPPTMRPSAMPIHGSRPDQYASTRESPLAALSATQ